MFIIIGIVGLLAITFSNLVLKHDVVATIISIVVIGISKLQNQNHPNF